MRIVIASLALCISIASSGQTFHVTEARKVLYPDGRPVLSRDSVDIAAVFIIQKKGKLSIHEDDGVGYLYFDKPGKYRLDSAFAIEKETASYKKSDSIFQIRKANNIAHCPERFRCATCNLYRPVPGHSLDIEPIGQFAINGTTQITEPAFRLEWVYPTDAPDKKYFISIKSMFDDDLDLLTTSETHIDIDLRKYNTDFIIYRIIANDCIQSTERVIRLKKS